MTPFPQPTKPPIHVHMRPLLPPLKPLLIPAVCPQVPPSALRPLSLPPSSFIRPSSHLFKTQWEPQLSQLGTPE